MRRGKETIKGVTLAELCVVLAVIAIISTVVISFSLLVSQRVAVSRARLNAMNDVEQMESVVDGWVGHMDLAGAALSAGEDNTRIKARLGNGEEYILSYTDGALTGELPGGGAISSRTEQVTAVEFRVLSNGTDSICFGTVTYAIPRVGGDDLSEQTRTFCVNPHVGDVTGGAE